MKTRYEREAYALAVLFTQVTPALSTMSSTQLYIILGTLGVYSILKVFSPLRWQARGTMTYLILTGDFLLCILLVIYTNGLNSSSPYPSLTWR